MINNNKYLGFSIGKINFGVLASNILGVISWDQANRILEKLSEHEKLNYSPDYFLGKIKINANIFPLLDLRKRFALESHDYSVFTTVILFKTVVTREVIFFAVVVDEIDDIHDLSDNIVPYEINAQAQLPTSCSLQNASQVYLLDSASLIKYESLSLATI